MTVRGRPCSEWVIQLQDLGRRATELLTEVIARHLNARRLINNFPGSENWHEQIRITSVGRDLRFVFCFNIHDFAGLRNP